MSITMYEKVGGVASVASEVNWKMSPLPGQDNPYYYYPIKRPVVRTGTPDTADDNLMVESDLASSYNKVNYFRITGGTKIADPKIMICSSVKTIIRYYFDEDYIPHLVYGGSGYSDGIDFDDSVGTKVTTINNIEYYESWKKEERLPTDIDTATVKYMPDHLYVATNICIKISNLTGCAELIRFSGVIEGEPFSPEVPELQKNTGTLTDMQIVKLKDQLKKADYSDFKVPVPFVPSTSSSTTQTVSSQSATTSTPVVAGYDPASVLPNGYQITIPETASNSGGTILPTLSQNYYFVKTFVPATVTNEIQKAIEANSPIIAEGTGIDIAKTTDKARKVILAHIKSSLPKANALFINELYGLISSMLIVLPKNIISKNSVGAGGSGFSDEIKACIAAITSGVQLESYSDDATLYKAMSSEHIEKLSSAMSACKSEFENHIAATLLTVNILDQAIKYIATISAEAAAAGTKDISGILAAASLMTDSELKSSVAGLAALTAAAGSGSSSSSGSGSSSSSTSYETAGEGGDPGLDNIGEGGLTANETFLYAGLTNTYAEPTSSYKHGLKFVSNGTMIFDVPLGASPELATNYQQEQNGGDLYTPYLITQLHAAASKYDDVGNTPPYRIVFMCKIFN